MLVSTASATMPQVYHSRREQRMRPGVFPPPASASFARIVAAIVSCSPGGGSLLAPPRQATHTGLEPVTSALTGPRADRCTNES
jgi:hypothetical protein